MIVDFGNLEQRDDGRATWDDGFLAMAVLVGQLFGDCTRRKVGAVIYNPRNGDLIQLGFNGAPAGEKGCLKGACPRGRHYATAAAFGEIVCATDNQPWPCAEHVEPGSSYDTGKGACIAIHAELNACLRAGLKARGMAIAVSEEPCDGCMKVIHGARIVKVVTPTSVFDWGLT